MSYNIYREWEKSCLHVFYLTANIFHAPAIRCPRIPLLYTAVIRGSVADSTKLLNCPHQPTSECPVGVPHVDNELQELVRITTEHSSTQETITFSARNALAAPSEGIWNVYLFGRREVSQYAQELLLFPARQETRALGNTQKKLQNVF